MLRKLAISILVFACLGQARAVAAETDPKLACRAEDIIVSIAKQPPDKLDFLGKRRNAASFRCEVYFSFKVYAQVWDRANQLLGSLNEVESSCATSALLKLPRIGDLSMVYDINSAGKYKIVSVSGGFPAEQSRLSSRLRASISQLERLRDADDASFHAEFARRNCPGADYQDPM